MISELAKLLHDSVFECSSKYCICLLLEMVVTVSPWQQSGVGLQRTVCLIERV